MVTALIVVMAVAVMSAVMDETMVAVVMAMMT
jgi:hypothetical protein